jgi:outer membrane protein OmpA-like peptidoglycan-associated protein
VRRVAAWSLALAGAAGCAGPVAPPPRDLDLVQARSDLQRVATSYGSDGAADAIAQAEEALDAAAEALFDGRRSARQRDDAVYVAVRKVEQARLTALHATARAALFHARTAAHHLADDLARREAFFADLARRRRAESDARVSLSIARRSALEAARVAGETIVDRRDGLLFRVPAETLFLPGTSLLRSGAEPRLVALAAALREGATCDVCIQVLDDVDGFRSEPWRLAERRRARIKDVLHRQGVPAEAFLPSPSRPTPGAQVDVLVRERRPALPAAAR